MYVYASDLAKNWLATLAATSKAKVPMSARGYLIDILGWIDNPERYVDSAAQLVKSLPEDTGRAVMAAVTEHVAIYTRDPNAYTAYVATMGPR